MLQVENLNQYYGSSHTLRDVRLEVPTGAVTTLLGRNGVGKTTLLKCIMGVVSSRSGRIVLDGTDLTGMSPHARASHGMGYVPQGREIFGRLTVEENLLMGLATKKGAASRNIPE
ncbi:MAG: ATP-binding cassette domain-containing protein, partial [Burkholderiales bacterium]